jgi:hypothetical protein
LAAAVVVVVAGVVAGAMVAQHGNSADQPSKTSTATNTAGTSPSGAPRTTTSTSPKPAMPAALRSCVGEVRAQDRLTKAMATGIGHLNHHIQAMKDNWAGKISVDQMKAMWKMTRLAGPSDIAAYKRDTTAVHTAGHPCATLSPSKLPASFQKQGTSCQERSAALANAAVAGEGAMHEWSYHLTQMALFKSGAFSSATANQRWLEVFDATPALVQHFDNAMSKLARAPRCA